MRKVFALSVFTSLASIVSAQINRYDVNVYTNPLPAVSTKSSYQYEGITYRDILEMDRHFKENALERERLQLEREKMERNEMMEFARISAAANAEGRKVVSDEIQTFNGTNLATKASVPIKVRIIKRNNGSIDISCLGINIGGVWKPCEKPISSLQDMYQKSTSEEEKGMVLGLMDLGNYLLDTDSEIYIMK